MQKRSTVAFSHFFFFGYENYSPLSFYAIYSGSLQQHDAALIPLPGANLSIKNSPALPRSGRLGNKCFHVNNSLLECLGLSQSTLQGSEILFQDFKREYFVLGHKIESYILKNIFMHSYRNKEMFQPHMHGVLLGFTYSMYVLAGLRFEKIERKGQWSMVRHPSSSHFLRVQSTGFSITCRL